MKAAILLVALALGACAENAEPPLAVTHGPWSAFVPATPDNNLVQAPEAQR